MDKIKQALNNLALEHDDDVIRRHFVEMFLEMVALGASGEDLWLLCGRVGVYPDGE